MKGYIMTDYTNEGDYLVDLSLEGGSGKAYVTSPAKIHTQKDGSVSVEIEWSSANYNYMKVFDKDYYPVNESGNSVFMLYLDSLYEELPVTAETTAMSQPHMIDYTLHFDTSSVREVNAGHSYASLIICAALAVIILAAVFLIRRHGNERK